MVCKYYNVIINIRAVKECLTQILGLIWGQVNFENKLIFQIFSLFTVKQLKFDIKLEYLSL